MKSLASPVYRGSTVVFERQADASDDWRHETGGLVKAYLRSPRRELSRSTLVHLSSTHGAIGRVI
ncbi:hypothetical protein ACU6QR_00430, partial [Aeromonas veronii]|uniref:hypothetical protein n=1 Tax=Aeromonas veronii TaxID=654 RepID=UPI00406CEBE3